MRVITGAEKVPNVNDGLRLTVSNVSIPGHPYYEVDIVPVHDKVHKQAVLMSWVGNGRKKDVWRTSLVSALNLALADDGRIEEDDDEEDLEEVDMDLFGYDYVDGRNARRTGKSLAECPSKRGSMEAKAWVRGWKDRKEDESKGNS